MTVSTMSSFLGDIIVDFGNLPSIAFADDADGHGTFFTTALLWAAAALIYYALVAIATRGDKYKRHETIHAIFCPPWHSQNGLARSGKRHYRCCSHRKGCCRCRNSNNNLGNGSHGNNNGNDEETQGLLAVGSEARRKCAFARMHMPPPLPLRPRKKRRNKQPPGRQRENTTSSASSATAMMVPSEADAITIRPTSAATTLLRQHRVAVSSRTSLKMIAATTEGVTSSTCESSSSTSSTTTIVRSVLPMQQQEIRDNNSNIPFNKTSKMTKKKNNFSCGPRTTTATTTLSAETDCSTTPVPIPRSTLIDLARMQDWSNLAIRCVTHRREAKRRDCDGLLPLHWACSGGPTTEAIHALLTAYPSSARIADFDGSTALHFAAHYGGSSDVMEILLEAYPDAIRITDAYDRTPLYHAVDKGASIDVLRVLLRADSSLAAQPCVPPVAKTGGDSPSSATSTKKTHRRRSSSSSGGFGPFRHIGAGRAPLTIAWNAMLSSARTTSLVATGAGPSSTRSRYRKPHRWTGKKWEKAVLLLKAAFLGSVDENDDECGDDAYSLFQPNYHPPQERKFRMVHAVLTFDHLLPPSAIDVAVELYPEQLTQRDELTGQTPLDQLASSRQKYISDERFQAILEALIWASPTSAYTPDEKGRYPLNMALESGRVWKHGIRELFHSAPDVLWEKDNPTGLFPFMIAAAASPTSTSFLQCPSSDFGVAKKPTASLSSTSKAVAFMGGKPPHIYCDNDSINSRICKRRRSYVSARNYSLDSTVMAAIAAAAAAEAAEAAAAASAEQAATMDDSSNVPLKKFAREQQGEEGQQDRLPSQSENTQPTSTVTTAGSIIRNAMAGYNVTQNSTNHLSTEEVDDSECQHLTTIYELLRACPESVCIL